MRPVPGDAVRRMAALLLCLLALPAQAVELEFVDADQDAIDWRGFLQLLQPVPQAVDRCAFRQCRQLQVSILPCLLAGLSRQRLIKTGDCTGRIALQIEQHDLRIRQQHTQHVDHRRLAAAARADQQQ